MRHINMTDGDKAWYGWKVLNPLIHEPLTWKTIW